MPRLSTCRCWRKKKWTDDIHSAYADITTKLFTAMKAESSSPSIRIPVTQQNMYGLKLQPMPLPKFNGDIREYPRFMDDLKIKLYPQ